MGRISAPHVSCPLRFGSTPNTDGIGVFPIMNSLRSSLTYPSSSFSVLCSNAEFHLVNHFLTDIVKKAEQCFHPKHSGLQGLASPDSRRQCQQWVQRGHVTRLTGAPVRPSSGWGDRGRLLSPPGALRVSTVLLWRFCLGLGDGGVLRSSHSCSARPTGGTGAEEQGP